MVDMSKGLAGQSTSATSSMLKHYTDGLTAAIQALPLTTVEEMGHVLQEARLHRRLVFVIGNGGSAASASHLMCDLNKTGRAKDVPLPRVIALTDDMPSITAWANDTAFENVFAEQLENLAAAGDVLIAISTSGRSRNIIAALKRAKGLGLATLGLTGPDGGELKDLVDICLFVQATNTGQIEDAHNAVCHMLVAGLRGNIKW